MAVRNVWQRSACGLLAWSDRVARGRRRTANIGDGNADDEDKDEDGDNSGARGT